VCFTDHSLFTTIHNSYLKLPDIFSSKHLFKRKIWSAKFTSIRSEKLKEKQNFDLLRITGKDVLFSEKYKFLF